MQGVDAARDPVVQIRRRGAALNFHLTKQEKLNITGALDNSDNQRAFQEFRRLAMGL